MFYAVMNFDSIICTWSYSLIDVCNIYPQQMEIHNRWKIGMTIVHLMAPDYVTGTKLKWLSYTES